ncbi:MAG: SurA N-terminal domain-containing protein [Sphingobacteriia bacterium]|nr:SurA N-terminal domain-containing protein [Sphingobacteriia bacterium]
MWSKLKSLLLLLIISLFFNNSFAGKIIASVGEKVITDYDVAKRVEMLRTIDPSIKHVDPKEINNVALEGLINEELFFIEAKKQKIELEDAEIQNSKALVEQQNNLKPGELEKFIRSKNLEPKHVYKQMQASLLWQKIVFQKIRPSLKVDDKELEKFVTDFNLIKVNTVIVDAIDNKNNNSKFLQLTKRYKTCEILEKEAKNLKFDVAKFETTLADLKPSISSKLLYISPGNVTPIIKENNQIFIAGLCNKSLNLSEEQKTEVKENILEQKIAVKANIYLNKLRRENLVQIYK